MWLNELVQQVERQAKGTAAQGRGSGASRRQLKAAKRQERDAEAVYNPRCVDDFFIRSKSDRVGTVDPGRRLLELILPSFFPEAADEAEFGDAFSEQQCVQTVKAIINRLDLISGAQQSFLLEAVAAEREHGAVLRADAHGALTSTRFVRWLGAYLAQAVVLGNSNGSGGKATLRGDAAAKAAKLGRKQANQVWILEAPSFPCTYEHFAAAFADRAARGMMARRVAQRAEDEWKACIGDFHKTFNPGSAPPSERAATYEEFVEERQQRCARQLCPHFVLRGCEAPCRNGRRHEAIDRPSSRAGRGSRRRRSSDGRRGSERRSSRRRGRHAAAARGAG